MIIHKYTPDSDQFRNKKILVTGHAGFTGSWICQWLGMLGADVYGLGLEPAYAPSIRKLTSDRFCSQEFLIDITNREEVQKIFNKVSPELVLHLAAQPLVFTSYLDVYGTMKSNVEGTSVILDASRTTSSVKRIVCITTDKVYKNLENKRFLELKPIFNFFFLKADTYLEIAHAVVTSAREISQKDLSDFETALHTILNKKIIFKTECDESLKSGFIVQFGNVCVDASFKSRLNALKGLFL